MHCPRLFPSVFLVLVSLLALASVTFAALPSNLVEMQFELDDSTVPPSGSGDLIGRAGQ